jgi:hypothetical protein
VNRTYYSQRIGRGPLADPTIDDLARALTLTVDEMWKRDYMQEWHGFTCVDAGEIGGLAAMPLADHIEAETGWRCAWPLPDPLFGGLELVEGTSIPDDQWAKMEQNAEDQVFDLIEYFHAHVSQGIENERSSFHSWEGCGWHYGDFDQAPAQELFRRRMNRTLMNYRGGFRINGGGQIEHTADEGLDQLIDAVLPTKDPDVLRGPLLCTATEVAPRKTCVLPCESCLTSLRSSGQSLRPRCSRRMREPSSTLPIASPSGT